MLREFIGHLDFYDCHCGAEGRRNYTISLTRVSVENKTDYDRGRFQGVAVSESWRLWGVLRQLVTVGV